MATIEVPFANQEGKSSVAQNSRETLINMFAEIEVSGRRKLIRRQRMGLAPIYALTGEKRCIEKHGGVHFLVVGNKFYTFGGVVLTERGTLDTSTGRCTMIFDDNGKVAISDGQKLYHWNGTTFTEPVTQSEVGTLTFLNGFGIYNEPDTGTFWWSALNDLTSWGALDFATAESNADNLIRVYEDHNELWLFGETSTEVWQQTGSADAPFARYQNAQMERGVRSPYCVAAEDNTLFWLGEDDIAYRADGFRPVRISNHSVERLIGDLPLLARQFCEAFVYTDGGHKFLTLNFPEYLTLQFNIANGFWNIARTYGEAHWDILGPQGTKTDYFLTTAGISELSRAVNTDDGILMERGGVSPPLSEGARRVVLRAFFLDCEVGRAETGIEPQVMLRVARDGETFGNERTRSLGLTGDYKRRAVWRGCGMGRKMMVEAMFTADAEFTILGADAEGDIL